MPFVKINVKQEIDKRLAQDSELRDAFEQACQEYELIKQLVEIRKKLGISQKELAERIGMSQQAVSRIETVGNSPTLNNFLKYIDGLGLQLRIEPVVQK